MEEEGRSREGGGSGSVLWIILSVAIVVVAAVAGFGLARLLSAPGQAAASQNAGLEEPEADIDLAQADCTYYEFDPDPITRTMNVPRQTRYITLKITLAIPAESAEAIEKLIESRKPELISWLNAYLAGCTLEDVRGTNNQNRLAREIKDAFNERLWPDRKPLIREVLFTRFNIQ